MAVQPTTSAAHTSVEEGFAAGRASPNRKAILLQRWRVVIFASIVVVAAVFRFAHLESMPPFIDEDGYSTFAQSLSRLPSWKYVVLHPDVLAPLTGDKPPLAIILQASLNSLVGDLVVSGRLLSAMAGVVTTILCFFLGRRLGGNSVGLVSMAVYACSPLAVLHERMVGQDPLMSTFSLGAVLLTWTAMERGSLLLASISALVGAVAVQFKVPGLATAGLLLALIVVADRAHRKYWYIPVIGAAGVLASYVLLMTGPGAASLQDQNQRLLVPFAYVGANLDVLRDAIATYFPFGLGVLGVVGAVVALRLNPRVGFICIVAILAWATPWVVLSRFSPPRYYLPADPYVCALIGLGAMWIVRTAGRMNWVAQGAAACAAAVIIAGSMATSVQYAIDFLAAPLSPMDVCQYRSCWPSGYGYAGAHDFIASSIPPGSTVAYVVDVDHRVALGLDRPQPAGIQSLGIVKHGAPLPVDSADPLYVVVDDVRTTEDGSGLRQLLDAYPELTVVARFLRPGSAGGVTIVRTPQTSTAART